MEANLLLFFQVLLAIITVGSLIWFNRSGTAKNMADVAEIASAKRLELEKRLALLEEKLNQTHYSVTIVFSVGEEPRVESVTIKPVKIKTVPPPT